MKNYYSLLFLALFIFLMPLHSVAEEMGEGPVWITAEIPSIEIKHNDKKIVIERIQNNENMIDWDYALTSRTCPPFCIMPMKLAKGVETIGELEMLDYIKQLSDGEKVLIVDSRDVWWTENGMIPGAVNIPWTHLHSKHASIEEIIKILEFDFGAIYQDGLLSFEHVKTLVFYCNGNWCGQSPTNIRSLLALGYPADKIKWYRGGMQAWQSLGLTTVKSGK